MFNAVKECVFFVNLTKYSLWLYQTNRWVKQKKGYYYIKANRGTLMITGTSADTIDTSLFVFTLIFVPCHIYYVNQSLLSHQPCFQQRQATVSVNKL